MYMCIIISVHVPRPKDMPMIVNLCDCLSVYRPISYAIYDISYTGIGF